MRWKPAATPPAAASPISATPLSIVASLSRKTARAGRRPRARRSCVPLRERVDGRRSEAGSRERGEDGVSLDSLVVPRERELTHEVGVRRLDAVQAAQRAAKAHDAALAADPAHLNGLGLDRHGLILDSGASRYVLAVHPTATRTQERLRELGLDVQVVELDESTRTATDAARAVGCDVAQIVKSLVLVAAGEPVLCLCAGDRRVDLEAIGGEARMATAAEARDATGFAVGGVPPLGHDRAIRTIVDASLRRFGEVWCAAGTPRAVFQVETERLLAAIPDARVAEDVTVSG